MCVRVSCDDARRLCPQVIGDDGQAYSGGEQIAVQVIEGGGDDGQVAYRVLNPAHGVTYEIVQPSAVAGGAAAAQYDAAGAVAQYDATAATADAADESMNVKLEEAA